MPTTAQKPPPRNRRRSYGRSLHDRSDPRDYPFKITKGLATHVGRTPTVDLSVLPEMPEVWSQGNLPSCVAHAVAAAWEFARRKAGHSPKNPSRLFVYYHGRWVEDNLESEEGLHSMRAGLKAIARVGVPPEESWPYDLSKWNVQPPPDAYQAARHDLPLPYCRVIREDVPESDEQQLMQLKAALVSGFPICFSFQLYQSYKDIYASGSNGVVPMRGVGIEDCQLTDAEHAAVLVGYDDGLQAFKVRNSEGPTFGASYNGGGHFWLPYAYAASASAYDFWTVLSKGES